MICSNLSPAQLSYKAARQLEIGNYRERLYFPSKKLKRNESHYMPGAVIWYSKSENVGHNSSFLIFMSFFFHSFIQFYQSWKKLMHITPEICAYIIPKCGNPILSTVKTKCPERCPDLSIASQARGREPDWQVVRVAQQKDELNANKTSSVTFINQMIFKPYK